MKSYTSHGKLLLTGEYLVLDGAKSLALPTKYSQSLSISTNTSKRIHWKSFNELNQIWFEDNFSIDTTSDNAITQRLIEVLKAAQTLNPDFLTSGEGFDMITHQDFNRLWGLGTSSTLINNIAQWANVDAYELLELTFGGSGYDIACAQHHSPIVYEKHDKTNRTVKEVNFSPAFASDLYFVYLNQKMNSRDGITLYHQNTASKSLLIDAINTITEALIHCDSLSDFQRLITQHETIIASVIGIQPVKQRLFKDFDGAIKSLGAWGGDFILVATDTLPQSYFKALGYHHIIPYRDMVLI